jgi:hypothetical protein
MAHIGGFLAGFLPVSGCDGPPSVKRSKRFNTRKKERPAQAGLEEYVQSPCAKNLAT